MKISKKRLKEIIKEEFAPLNEMDTKFSCEMKGGTWHEGKGCTFSSEFANEATESEYDRIMNDPNISMFDKEELRADAASWGEKMAVRQFLKQQAEKEEIKRSMPKSEGRLVGRGAAQNIAKSMNDLADTLLKFDPSSVEPTSASSLRAAWTALASSMGETFGDSLENAAVPAPRGPGPLEEECGATHEPMPMPGPPPEGDRALEPAYDDNEGHVAKAQLYSMVKDSNDLANMLGDQDQLPSWVQAKVTKAADYVNAVKNYLEYQREAPQEMNETKISKERLIKIIKEELTS